MAEPATVAVSGRGEGAGCSHAATRPAARASSDLLVRIVAAGALRPPPGVTQAACSADRACSHRAGQEARRSSPRGEGEGQRQPRHSHLPRPPRRPIPARNSEAAACPDPAARYRPPAIMSRPPVLSAYSGDQVPDEAPSDRRSDIPTTRADRHDLVVLPCDSSAEAADVVLRGPPKRRSTGTAHGAEGPGVPHRARRSDQPPDGEAWNRTGCAARPLRVQGAKTFPAIACPSRGQASVTGLVVPASSPRMRAV